MGEAKAKTAERRRRAALSHRMRRARFDLLALGARRSPTRLMADELSHWSDPEERVLGLVLRDRNDDDFGWILMARDKIGRFRCVDLDMSLRSPAYAEAGVRDRIGRAVNEGDFLALGDQEDETNHPTDVLHVGPEIDVSRLHPHFRGLLDSPARAPARAVFREIGPWLAPTDPHFVKEFQENAFDQRLWEMYLWATFRELGFDITQPEAPDFLCAAPGIEFAVEATTVASSTSGVLADRPDPRTVEEMAEFLAHYMPIKYGSSLTSKLNKKNKNGESYWQRADVRGKPFLLAVADFHVSGSVDELGSMSYTHSALWPYLYGHRVDWEIIGGELVVRATKGGPHAYKGKTIETGFFDLEGAENISAIIFSNAGTLAKFDRMGLSAGVEAPGHLFFRFGYRFDPDPKAVHPLSFSEPIGLGDYVEHWSDELQVFHNPNARQPLGEGVFGGITQHFFKDGDLYSITPEGTVLASRTMILHLVGDREGKQVV